MNLAFAKRKETIEAPLFDLIEKELTAYFAGTLSVFKTPLSPIGTAFQRLVWKELCNIPFGATKSYAEMAEAIGKPTSIRAAANANGANPLPIIIPCHRVVRTGGALGGYSLGIEKKQWLLTHEEKMLRDSKDFYAKYHDEEWGIPLHDDQKLFELLILEGAQAGLSWETILKRRDGYRKAFHKFDPKKVAAMADAELESLRQDEGIIRNRLKIYAARQNAKVFLEIQKEFGSFDRYLWKFVDGKPIVNRRQSMKELPPKTPLSDTISKDLKKRGMTFVGSTIIYAYMQAVGLVDDHLNTCWKSCTH